MLEKIRDKIVIEVKNSKDTIYTLNINRKINVILGESSTGKTYFSEIINNLGMWASKTDNCTELDIFAPRYISGVDWIKYINSKNNTIIVFDDDFQKEMNIDFIREINKSNNIFIIMSRSVPKALTLSIDSIYELRREKKNGTNYISNKTIYKKKYTNDIKNLDCIITEDKKLGYELIKRIFDKHIESSCGKSNITLKSLDVAKNKELAIIVDTEAFGAFYFDLIAIKDKFRQIKIFDLYSIEYMLCFIHYYCNLYNELNNPEFYCDYSKFLSMERFYTYLLDLSLLHSNKVNYSKKSIRLLNKIFNKNEYYSEFLLNRLFIPYK